MVKSSVSLDCTGQFSSLFLDYLGRKPELATFYNEYPEVENFARIIESRVFAQEKREILVHVLQDQYAGLDMDKDFLGQIQSLSSQKTFTVTTGHQLNLCTGPLYFIYKIVSTINLSRKLKDAYPGHHFVPVYWMATEDHDFDEINYFKLEGKKYHWKSDQTGAVGDFIWDTGFAEFLKEVTAFAPEFFLKAYKGSKTLSEAVRKYVHHIFGAYGLVVVDGNDPSFKKSFQQILIDDVTEHHAFKLATAQTQKLEGLGYRNQIYPREINLFYMQKGSRERIEKVGPIYKVLNTDIQFTREQLLEEIKNRPEKFSPNVVLRPIYQELILPNLAYLGGPAEVAYWLQLKLVFDHFEIPFPVLLPRNFAMVLDMTIERKIQQLELRDEQLFEPILDWKKRFVSEHAKIDFQMEEERSKLSDLFGRKGMEASALEKSLQNAFEAGKVRALKILTQLSEKVRKAEERRLEIQITRRHDIQAYIYPGGSPQERTENMMRFYLPNPNLIADLLEVFDPLDFSFLILRKNERER